ncbi:hypothetical protein IAE30_29905, partial [Pantoea sp. S61]|nr:hypothetical protein [Pantoea sp. S61]
DVADDGVQHGGLGGQRVTAASEVLNNVGFGGGVMFVKLHGVIRQALRAKVTRLIA